MRSAGRRRLVCAMGALIASSSALAADKSGYSLFNPTPDRLLRELTTDRPDVSESAFTVDAGRIQVESNLFGYWRSRPDEDGTVTDAYDVARTNLRIGLTSSLEVSLVWQPYGVVVAHPRAAPTIKNSGMGGINVRAKYNVWGNDTFEKPGATALALLPILVLPTDRDNGISPEHVQGGLVVPFAVKLTDKFALAINGGVVYVREGGATGHDAEYLASASLSYEWNDKLGTYYEIGAILDRDNDPLGDIAFVGTGVTYKLNKNLQLDAGVNFGITRASDRINPFVGISARF